MNPLQKHIEEREKKLRTDFYSDFMIDLGNKKTLRQEIAQWWIKKQNISETDLLRAVVDMAEGMKKTKIVQSGENDKMWVKMRIATITKRKKGWNYALSSLQDKINNLIK